MFQDKTTGDLIVQYIFTSMSDAVNNYYSRYYDIVKVRVYKDD